MYNLSEYSGNYSKASGNLWQHYRDESALNDNDSLDNWPGNSALLWFDQKIASSIGHDSKKLVK